MWMTTRMLCLLVAAASFFGVCRVASADRPSLIDLQATVDQVVSGLCNGDETTCGTTPAAPAVGTLTVDTAGGALPLDLVELKLSASRPIACSPACRVTGATSFSTVDATVLPSPDAAGLIPVLLSGTLLSQVAVSLPGAGTVLTLSNAVVTQADEADEHNRVLVKFTFQEIALDWQSQHADWNWVSETGNGCMPKGNEMHVDLAGNSPGNLTPSETAATWTISIETLPAPLRQLSFEHEPPHPCYLIAVGDMSIPTFAPTFERLWTENDQFPAARQAVQSIDVHGSLVRGWQLHIESGVMTEQVDLLLDSGDLTYRSFDPITGAETGASTAGF